MNDLLPVFRCGGIVGIPDQEEPKGYGDKYFQEFFEGFAQDQLSRLVASLGKTNAGLKVLASSIGIQA